MVHFVNYMHRVYICLLFPILFSVSETVGAQGHAVQAGGLQCGYEFHDLTEAKGKKIHYLNLRLDYYEGKSYFYDEFSYTKDSLFLLAFDVNGNTRNYDEVANIKTLPKPRLDDRVIIDYKKGSIQLCYSCGKVKLRGNGQLTMPEWSITGEEAMIGSYKCKKAIADYLGRTWIVWYTEDIPASIGPWLLWGAPGLIVSAEDDKSLFSFKLVWVDRLNSTERIGLLETVYPDSEDKLPRSKYLIRHLKEIEKIYARMMTDLSFFEEMNGLRIMGSATRKDLSEALKYIPLIPDEYWKDK